MKIRDITNFLEFLAPLSLQETYDNSGLITGNSENEITGVLITLDTTEEVLDEAINKKANLIISHHPIIFKGLKKITGNTYVERIIIKAIQNKLSIYALHTNLDNVITGVNNMLCKKIGLNKCKVLRPAESLLKKLVTFVPKDHISAVRDAIFEAGAGHIGNYDSCSFNISGEGTYRGGEDSDPFVGEKGIVNLEKEMRIETIFPKYLERKILSSLLKSHPYEEVAYDIYPLDNIFNMAGAGMIGEFDKRISETGFLELITDKLQCKILRHTALLNKDIVKVAICGGSGSFLIKDAIRHKADVFLSGDFKYHDFFDADNKILIIDAGHYETEQFTKELIYDTLNKNFNNFACFLSEINTNPINYY